MSPHNFAGSASLSRFRVVSQIFCAVLIMGSNAGAQNLNFIQNGDFTELTNGTDRYLPGAQNQYGANTTTATGWVATSDYGGASGYYGIYSTAGATTTPYAPHIYGPVTAPPEGGNFFFTDGADNLRASISQTMTGLTVGQKYNIDFDWAMAQFTTLSGATTGQWQVFLDYDHPYMFTPELNNPNHGFTGWFHQTFSFVADSATQNITFLGLGTPNGLPPVELLSGVSVTAVPEPSAALLLSGALAFGAIYRRKR